MSIQKDKRSTMAYSNQQALVSDLRTMWYKLSSFDIEKLRQFLNLQPTYSL